MPSVLIDKQRVEVPEGATILDAARKLGLDIPTLCYLEGYEPSTSCMVCLVKIKGQERLVPSCATRVEAGMEVESETDEVRQVRRTGLELLLSDHLGDCTAPCALGCPAHMDIPLMLRQVAAGQLRDAIITVKRDIALPAVLGRICPEPCERACRRRDVDHPVSICLVKRYVADADLASERPYRPPCRPSTGKTVAIVGTGPTGLTAAFHLCQAGHACTLFDKRPHRGGKLRQEFDEEQLPRDVLNREIGVIEALGATFRPNVKVGQDIPLAELRQSSDAVLVATGALAAAGDAEVLGLSAAGGSSGKLRLEVDRSTYRTALEGVFAAGDAVGPGKLVVRCVADGKAAAHCIDQHLREVDVTGPPTSLTTRYGRLDEEEIARMAVVASPDDRLAPAGGATTGFIDDEARAESLRCLHCDCLKQDTCKLRRHAQAYGASASRYRGARRRFERHDQHADIAYEPGKCILCGSCIQIAGEAAEPLGLTFVGRGFDVRVAVPFERSIAEGLQQVARACADACPTAALTLAPGADGNPS
jgi:ferredoxin